MAYNISGITVRNLPEQVDYLTDLLNAIAKTMGVDISMNPSNGTLSITKTNLSISGTLDVEGAVSLGNSAEVDGTLTLNSPNDLVFKEDNSTLANKVLKEWNFNLKVDLVSTGSAVTGAYSVILDDTIPSELVSSSQIVSIRAEATDINCIVTPVGFESLEYKVFVYTTYRPLGAETNETVKIQVFYLA